MLNDERRGVEEAYASATMTSDMRVEADRRSDADVIIASGLSPTILGSALLRLQGEWDRSEKPRLLEKDAAANLMATLPRAEGDTRTGPELLAHHYGTEARLLLGKLKSFRLVNEQLGAWLRSWNVDHPETVSAAVVRWWLSDKCPVCSGTRWQVLQGVKRPCKSCSGSGLMRVPKGEHGRRAATYLDDAVQTARTSIKKRLRPT